MTIRHEKLNNNFVLSIKDDDIRGYVMRKLKEYQIDVYDMEDVFEFQAIRKFLSCYHRGLTDFCSEAEKSQRIS